MAAKGDKTEAPTPKKKKDARKKGQVAKSQDLAPWLALLVGTYVLPLTIGGLARAMTTSLAEVTTIGTEPDAGKALDILGELADRRLPRDRPDPLGVRARHHGRPTRAERPDPLAPPAEAGLQASEPDHRREATVVDHLGVGDREAVRRRAS